MYWHRTPKTARIDVEPILYMNKRPLLEQRIDAQAHKKTISKQLTKSLRLAFEFYEQVKTPQLLLSVLNSRRDNSDSSWYWNHHNVPLAHAFTLALCGNPDRGSKVLEEFFEFIDISEKAKKKVLGSFHAMHPNNRFNPDTGNAGNG